VREIRAQREIRERQDRAVRAVLVDALNSLATEETSLMVRRAERAVLREIRAVVGTLVLLPRQLVFLSPEETAAQAAQAAQPEVLEETVAQGHQFVVWEVAMLPAEVLRPARIVREGVD
jgi:hypothetical protein